MKLIAIVAISCVLSLTTFAQSAKKNVRSISYDTAYIVKYPEKLGLYMYQSRPSYSIDIAQRGNDPAAAGSGISSITYQTVAANVTGFGFDYDKIGINIGFKTPHSSDDRKGNSDYSQLGISVGGIKFRVEASLNWYKGFYDNSSSNYIPSFGDSTAYYQNSGLNSNTFKIKAFYFMNRKKRFSYSAAYSNSARQVKSAGSFIIASNVYSYHLSSDGAIIPTYVDSFYHSWQHLSDFRVTGISLGIGYSHTFVIFKKVYLNLLYTAGLEEQHRILETSDHSCQYDSWVTVFSAYDFRSSLGFNASNFFFNFQTIIDGNTYNFSSFSMRSEYFGLGFQIGYRFPVKTPGFYKKIQKTKVYKMI